MLPESVTLDREQMQAMVDVFDALYTVFSLMDAFIADAEHQGQIPPASAVQLRQATAVAVGQARTAAAFFGYQPPTVH